jgi:hypothetical protein
MKKYKKKKILIVSYGGGHINIINEIAPYLNSTKDYEIVILALTTAYESSTSCEGVVVKKLSNYLPLFDNEISSILRLGQDLLDENYTDGKGISRFDSILYLGLSMHDLIFAKGAAQAKLEYQKRKRQAFLPVKVMSRILEYENPDIVLTTSSPRFEQASVIAAKKMHIPTVQILDLMGDTYPLPEADYISVMNETVKSQLVLKGICEDKVYVLGQPIFEKTRNEVIKHRKKKSLLKRKMGFPGSCFIISYFCQRPAVYNADFSFASFLDYSETVEKLLINLSMLHERKNIKIIVRPHPNESIEHYLAYEKNLILDNNRLDLNELLAISDICLTHSSTVGIQSVLSGNPTYTFSFKKDKFYPMPLYREKPFVFFENEDLLLENLNEIVINDKSPPKIQDDFLRLNFLVNLGNMLKKIRN